MQVFYPMLLWSVSVILVDLKEPIAADFKCFA